MESSGRLGDFRFPAQDSTSEDTTNLLRAIAKSTSVVSPGQSRMGYKALYRHPLTVSKHRFEHEVVLNRIMSCPLHKQAAAAIVSRDAHSLEEVFIRGAPVDIADPINGFTPLHLAVQLGSLECVMVLLNIGVDVNAASSSGATPLFLSGSQGMTEVKALLLERGAKSDRKSCKGVHSSTILTYRPPNMKASALVLAPGSRKITVMAKNHSSH